MQAAFLGAQKAYFATPEEIDEWEEKKTEEDQRRLNHYNRMAEILPNNEFLQKFSKEHKGGMVQKIQKAYRKSPHLTKLMTIAKNTQAPQGLIEFANRKNQEDLEKKLQLEQ